MKSLSSTTTSACAFVHRHRAFTSTSLIMRTFTCSFCTYNTTIFVSVGCSNVINRDLLSTRCYQQRALINKVDSWYARTRYEVLQARTRYEVLQVYQYFYCIGV